MPRTMRVAAGTSDPGVACGADHEPAGRTPAACVNGRNTTGRGARVEAAVLRVADDADDGAPVAADADEPQHVARPRDALTDGILVRKNSLSASVLLRITTMPALSRSVAANSRPLQQRNARRAEVLADWPCGIRRAASPRRPRADLPSAFTSSWKSAARSGIDEPNADFAHAGNRADLELHALVQRLASSASLRRRGRRAAPPSSARSRSVSPVVHLGELQHRARQEPRARQQHDRHGDLRDDEPALQPLPAQRCRSSRLTPAAIHAPSVPSFGERRRERENHRDDDASAASVKPSTMPSSRISFARGE